MTVQLGDIFPGERPRSTHRECEDLIDRRPIPRPRPRHADRTIELDATDHLGRDRDGPRPAYPHDPDTADTRGGRDRSNGLDTRGVGARARHLYSAVAPGAAGPGTTRM